jgi:hypothetical protein
MASKALNASWQRCRLHFMRNVLADAGRQGRGVVSAFIATAFSRDDAAAARAQWRKIANQLRPKLPKLAAFLDDVEADVLAYVTFPAQHRAKLHSTNPIERRFLRVMFQSGCKSRGSSIDAVRRRYGFAVTRRHNASRVEKGYGPVSVAPSVVPTGHVSVGLKASRVIYDAAAEIAGGECGCARPGGQVKGRGSHCTSRCVVDRRRVTAAKVPLPRQLR